jgi:hypothetical protein
MIVPPIPRIISSSLGSRSYFLYSSSLYKPLFSFTVSKINSVAMSLSLPMVDVNFLAGRDNLTSEES